MDNKKDPENELEVIQNNVSSIDDRRISRLLERGNLYSIIEEYEILRLKLLYDKELTKVEAIRLVTLCKYLMDNGPSEAFRLSCQYLYERYIKKFGL
jgi:hypothetical protein